MILLYAISFILLVSVIAISLKQSEFGLLVLLAELPLVIGIGLYPLLFECGFVLPCPELISYLNQNAHPGWVMFTSLCIILRRRYWRHQIHHSLNPISWDGLGLRPQ